MKDYRTLGTDSIGKLLMKLSMPVLVGMISITIFNFVDLMFIGYGVEALAIGGVALTFPVQMVIVALGVMIGNGAVSIISNRLGAQSLQKTLFVTGNALLLSVGIGIVLTLAVKFFLSDVIILLGSPYSLFYYAKEYLSVICLGAVFLISEFTLGDIARSEGKTRVMMMSSTVSSFLNILLDYIFIFIFDWGVEGAAIATVISQGVAFAIASYFLLTRQFASGLKVTHFIPDFKIISQIIKLGVPIFVQNIGICFLYLVVNNSLKKFSGNNSDISISAYGIATRITSLMVLPLIALTLGCHPLISYNYGAGKFDRVKETLRKSIIISTLYGALISILVILFRAPLMKLFTYDFELIETGMTICQIIFIGFFLEGFLFIVARYFQAIEKFKPALFLDLRRYYISIPAIFILGKLYGEVGIWYSIPLSSFIGGLIVAGFLIYEFKKNPNMGSTAKEN